jgi:hypothetical protein
MPECDDRSGLYNDGEYTTRVAQRRANSAGATDRATALVGDLHDDVFGRDVHGAGGALMRNEPSFPTTVAIGDRAAERRLDPGALLIEELFRP